MTDIYYHGSRISGLFQLKINNTRDNPFGPAVYLTKDPNVAKCYCIGGSPIYEVNISGDPLLTIDLDKDFDSQSGKAKKAILKSLKLDKQNVNICSSINVRDLIHPKDCSRSSINRTLSENGIWLLYGHLLPMEKSGQMDRGVQFAVIDESSIKVLKETNYYAIINA